MQTPTTTPRPSAAYALERRSLRLARTSSRWLLAAVFTASALLTLLDPDGSRTEATKLGFPAYIALYPLAIAKLSAVVVILQKRWPTLRTFAFAGLLFDMILALMAHVHEGDFPSGWLAVFGIVVWGVAFATDHLHQQQKLRAQVA